MTQMMKLLTFSLPALFFAMNALANIAEEQTEPVVIGQKVLGQKILELKDGRGTLAVTTRKTEAVIGRPYTLELRVACGAAAISDWTTVPVVDSESVCDVKPKSPKLTADGKQVSVLIRETDSDRYNRETRQAKPEALKALKPVCKTKATEFFFPIEKLCR